LGGNVVLQPVRPEGGEHGIVVAQFLIEIKVRVGIFFFSKAVINRLVKDVPCLVEDAFFNLSYRIEVLFIYPADGCFQNFFIEYKRGLRLVFKRMDTMTMSRYT